ncbi:diguanylate cyclase [Pseudomonas taiwanensis]|uniref:GGDEF domain-containing protein n=1 Tax=Pseudomonas taiwanensis TaxID=470150 RepID=UPI0015B8437E|nr:GAF domain-containing protein [Pseudomonas taiwanensis]NWL80553.1 diguanylate cyclase [Pseudomonas taiwanensis]
MDGSAVSYERNLECLVRAIQELSLARNLDRIAEIVRSAARELVGADGATFVLRDGDRCFYKDEDAISPLWKGLRFPMETCISGWAMINREPAVIEDIYQDPRIPHDAYRPTFVKSLVMVPIRSMAPVGAIGTYWATPRLANMREVGLLQALADSTSVAMENVQLYDELEQRVIARTQDLVAANRLLYDEACERERVEQDIQRFSMTDELTGLHNRLGFQHHAAGELDAARQRDMPCLLLHLLVGSNDSASAESLPLTAARMLRAQFRRDDLLARLGGGEFLALTSGYGDPNAVLQRLRAGLGAFNRATEQSLTLRIGHAESARGQDLEQLLFEADNALHRSGPGWSGV